MNITAVANLIPVTQPHPVVAAQKPATPQHTTPVAAGDADGDNDGSGGAGAKGILA